MKILAKKDLLEVTGEKFGKYVTELGYTNYQYEIIPTPHMSNRGLLHSRGSFTGPGPYKDTSRPVEDEYSYSFFVLEDPNYKNLLILEVKLDSAMIAKFKILPAGIYSVEGSLPHA